LTKEESVDDDTKAPIWIVEIWAAKSRWIRAADFRRPCDLEKAIRIAKKRQEMRQDYTYRIRNLQNGAVLMAAVL
jgi:hypothetical protein